MSDKITAMTVGGKALAKVKRQLKEFVKPGTTYEEIEAFAQQAIATCGMKPSFSTVPDYHWATCIMKNAALCHGIPKNGQVVAGDVVSIDVGLINQGYHLDTSITFGLEPLDAKKRWFLTIGQETLNKAIAIVKPGISVYQISRVIEKNLNKHGCGAVYQLTGHGVGKELHEEPAIPCVADPLDKQIKLSADQTIAIEVMYTLGQPDLVLDKNGWTYTTLDGSLSGMFEETVLVTRSGFKILTD